MKVVKRLAEEDVDESAMNHENFKRVDHHSDVRVAKIAPLIPPALLLEELPTDPALIEHVRSSQRILRACTLPLIWRKDYRSSFGRDRYLAQGG